MPRESEPSVGLDSSRLGAPPSSRESIAAVTAALDAIRAWRRGDVSPPEGASLVLNGTLPYDLQALGLGQMRIIREVLWPHGLVRHLPLRELRVALRGAGASVTSAGRGVLAAALSAESRKLAAARELHRGIVVLSQAHTSPEDLTTLVTALEAAGRLALSADSTGESSSPPPWDLACALLALFFMRSTSPRMLSGLSDPEQSGPLLGVREWTDAGAS